MILPQEEIYDNRYLNEPQPVEPPVPRFITWLAIAWLTWQDVSAAAKWVLTISLVLLVAILVWRLGIVHSAAPPPVHAVRVPAVGDAPACYVGLSIAWLSDGQERPFVVAKLPRKCKGE